MRRINKQTAIPVHPVNQPITYVGRMEFNWSSSVLLIIFLDLRRLRSVRWFSETSLSLSLRNKLAAKEHISRKDWSEITDSVFEKFVRETAR